MKRISPHRHPKSPTKSDRKCLTTVPIFREDLSTDESVWDDWSVLMIINCQKQNPESAHHHSSVETLRSSALSPRRCRTHAGTRCLSLPLSCNYAADNAHPSGNNCWKVDDAAAHFALKQPPVLLWESISCVTVVLSIMMHYGGESSFKLPFYGMQHLVFPVMHLSVGTRSHFLYLLVFLILITSI